MFTFSPTLRIFKSVNDAEFLMKSNLQLNFQGLFLAVLNSLLDSIYIALANILPVTSVFIIVARALTHILGSSLVLSVSWKSDIRKCLVKNQKLLFLRALINGITLTLKAVCVQYMSIAELSIISQTTPVFTCIIAVLFLKERITLVDTTIITFCFVGVFMVLQPDVDTVLTRPSYLIAVGFMIVSCMVNAATTVMLKKLASANVHYAAIMFSSGCSTMFYGLLGFVFLFNWGEISRADLCIESQLSSLLVLVAGIFGFYAQYTNILALKHIKASVKSVLCNTLNVFLGFIFTIVLTPEKADLNCSKIVGAILVLISGFLLYTKKEGKLTCKIGDKDSSTSKEVKLKPYQANDDSDKLLHEYMTDSDS